MKRQYQSLTFDQLYNLLEILTKAIRICIKQRITNARFWQIVNKRELIIVEMDYRRS